MAGFSLTTRKQTRSGTAHAIDAATMRIAAAAKGDLSTPTPVMVGKHFPEFAEALNNLFANVRANFDSVSTLAMFDPVTSLPNRTHFREEAERMLRALPDCANAALFFVDLDNFKSVNDTYGHAQGDQLLAMVAQRLRIVADNGSKLALVGRLAGDEFTLLFGDLDGRADANHLGGEILGAMTAPFDVAGHSVDVGASIGIALRSDAGHALTDLMRAADVAMYHAKAQGRRQFQFYSEALAEQLAARSQLDRDLRAGIARGELALMVQPQISLATGAIIASEALLRWQHPARGTMMPHQFLAAAEESGLIFDISNWSLVEAARIAADWKRRRTSGRLAVNLGARQMSHADFFAHFRGLVGKRKIPMASFEIEVTEDNMMACGDTVIRELAAIRDEGARITIDTAGIGMSSLAQLRTLPVDRLKIHHSLIADVAIDARAQAIVQAMIGLGHGLGYQVIAAGVETPEQIDILRVMGCDAVQGYAIAPPMSLDAFAAWRSPSKKRAKTTA
jgi:diguanylate cyclase